MAEVEGLLSALQQLSLAADVAQSELLRVLQPLIEPAARVKPHVAVLLAKYGWSFDDDEDLWMSPDSLRDLAQQITLTQSRSVLECFTDSLAILAQCPQLLQGRLCVHVRQSAAQAAVESPHIVGVLSKHGLLGAPAERWAEVEPHTLMMLSGEVTRLCSGGSGTPPVTPSRRGSFAFQRTMSPRSPLCLMDRTSSAPKFDCDTLAEAACLPMLIDVWDPADREKLFLTKASLCHTVLDFALARDFANIQMKTSLLDELTSYVVSSKAEALSPTIQRAVVACFTANCVRALPSYPQPVADAEEEDVVQEPCWPHLKGCYALLLELLQAEYAVTTESTGIDERFVSKLFPLLESRDPQERDCLRSLLYRLYYRLVGLRKHVRAEMTHFFLRYAYEDTVPYGLPELLEVLVSVVNGFAAPLKPEHRTLLLRVLMPLHKGRHLALFHGDLCFCVVRLTELEPALLAPAVQALLRMWPETAGVKSVLFLAELEELICSSPPGALETCTQGIVRRLRLCVASTHFQVCHRALAMLEKPAVQAVLALYPSALQAVLAHVARLGHTHWHVPVQLLSLSLLPVLRELSGARDAEQPRSLSSPSTDTMSAASSELSLAASPPYSDAGHDSATISEALEACVAASPPAMLPKKMSLALAARRVRPVVLGQSAEA